MRYVKINKWLIGRKQNMIKKKPLKIQKIISQGFTLIELLVVISIIGLLSTLLLANFNSMRSRARDAERESDLRNIQTALRLYYNDFNKYPKSASDGKISGCGSGTSDCTWGGSFSVSGRDPYMSILPGDPSSDRVYVYYQGDDTDTYTLQACLENKSNKNCDTPITDCTDNFKTGDGVLEGCIYTVQP